MSSLDSKLLLEHVIHDYMLKRGFHQAAEAFTKDICSSENYVAINSPNEAFLQAWWGKFTEAFKSRFPDDVMLAADSFEKVTQTVKDLVASNDSLQFHAFHPEANISNVMRVISSPHSVTPSPMMESNGPDLMDATISNLLSSFDTDYALLDSSFQRDMPSFPDMGEFGGMLPFPNISGDPVQQMPTVPPEWNVRDDIPGINVGGPTLMDSSIHAPANALPASLEFSDPGNSRSLQQPSHQGWPTAMLRETEQRTPEYLQQIIAPTGGIMTSSGEPTVTMQEKINQLGLQSSNTSGLKRKTSMSSLASVWEEKAIAAGVAKENTIGYFSRGSVGLISSSRSIHALRKKFNFAPALNQAKQKDNSFQQIKHLDTKTSKLLCCHFDSNGELLATGGYDGEVMIWEPEIYRLRKGKAHAHHVTDVRFRRNSMVFATSSFDKTVKIWDAAKLNNPPQDLVGHGGHVMSIDFHPKKLGLLSSCDSSDEIRLWDVNKGDCKLNFKGGIRQVRFQPELGDFLASSTGNVINIFDVETSSIQKKLQGHAEDILSICWDMSGKYLASVSEDSARIWSVSGGNCIHELHSSGNKFQSCTFYPGHPNTLVIGSDKFLELWNPFFRSNTTSSYSAHSGIISSLAASPSKKLIASVSHDQWIKIWR